MEGFSVKNFLANVFGPLVLSKNQKLMSLFFTGTILNHLTKCSKRKYKRIKAIDK